MQALKAESPQRPLQPKRRRSRGDNPQQGHSPTGEFNPCEARPAARRGCQKRVFVKKTWLATNCNCLNQKTQKNVAGTYLARRRTTKFRPKAGHPPPKKTTRTRLMFFAPKKIDSAGPGRGFGFARSSGRGVEGSRGRGVQGSRGPGVEGSRGPGVQGSSGRWGRGVEGRGVEGSRGRGVEGLRG